MSTTQRWINAVAAASMLAFAASVGAQAEIAGGATKKSSDIKAAVNVSQAMLNGAAKNAGAWLHSNGDYTNSRYYPGSQVNTKNVKNLKPAFVFQTEVLESMETAPIVVDGVMYLTTSYDHVYAINAVTGEEYWH